MSILPMQTQNLSKLFCGYGKSDSKLYVEKPNSETMLHNTEEKSVEKLTLPDCKTYCHATVIKTA